MTDATREALVKISQALHEAGWDAQDTLHEPSITPENLTRIRHAYETLLRQDHIDILEATLGEKMTVDEAGEKLGLDSEKASILLQEALQRLSDFVETYEPLTLPGNTAGKHAETNQPRMHP